MIVSSQQQVREEACRFARVAVFLASWLGHFCFDESQRPELFRAVDAVVIIFQNVFFFPLGNPKGVHIGLLLGYPVSTGLSSVNWAFRCQLGFPVSTGLSGVNWTFQRQRFLERKYYSRVRPSVRPMKSHARLDSGIFLCVWVL